MIKGDYNRLNSRVNQGFETKLVGKRPLLAVRLSSYLFPLNTLGCAQSEALWVDENVRVYAKTWGAVCREQSLPFEVA